MEQEIKSKSHSLRWKTRLKYALHTATGLNFLHCQSEPIIHRDIKPANYLVRDGVVLLADFGLAHRRNAKKKPSYGSSIASWAYRAPETMEDPPDFSTASDIYVLLLN